MSSKIFQPSSKLICGISICEVADSLSPSACNDSPNAAILSKSFQASEFPREAAAAAAPQSDKSLLVRLALRDERSEAGMAQLPGILLLAEQLRKRGGSLLNTRAAMMLKTKMKTGHNVDLLNQKLKMPKSVPRAKKYHQDSNNRCQPPTDHESKHNDWPQGKYADDNDRRKSKMQTDWPAPRNMQQ